jgi:hypothetical protein
MRPMAFFSENPKWQNLALAWRVIIKPIFKLYGLELTSVYENNPDRGQ